MDQFVQSSYTGEILLLNVYALVVVQDQNLNLAAEQKNHTKKTHFQRIIMLQSMQSQDSLYLTPKTKTQPRTRECKTPTQQRTKDKFTVFGSKSKQNFLTDPQTSDHTEGKQSSQLQIKLSLMEEKIRKLGRENSQLKSSLTNMKANKFYTINQEMVKEAIYENERLKREMVEIRKRNEDLMIQNQFLQRNNKYLKFQLQNQAEKHLRKSVEMARSHRMKQSTSRTVIRNDRGQDVIQRVRQGMKQKEELQTQNFQSNTSQHKKIQRRVIQQVKSNPDLLRNQNTRYRSDEEQFILTERKQNGYNLRESSKKNAKNDCSNSSNQHFLREFQKYQRKMFESKRKNQFQQSQNSSVEPITPRSRKSPQCNPQILSPKSNENSLRAILQRKKEMVDGKMRGKQSRQFRNIYQERKDQNDLKLSNLNLRKTHLNQQNLVGNFRPKIKQDSYQRNTDYSKENRINEKNVASRGYCKRV